MLYLALNSNTFPYNAQRYVLLAVLYGKEAIHGGIFLHSRQTYVSHYGMKRLPVHILDCTYRVTLHYFFISTIRKCLASSQ